jgi:hypothetical protein
MLLYNLKTYIIHNIFKRQNGFMPPPASLTNLKTLLQQVFEFTLAFVVREGLCFSF